MGTERDTKKRRTKRKTGAQDPDGSSPSTTNAEPRSSSNSEALAEEPRSGEAADTGERPNRYGVTDSKKRKPRQLRRKKDQASSTTPPPKALQRDDSKSAYRAATRRQNQEERVKRRSNRNGEKETNDSDAHVEEPIAPSIRGAPTEKVASGDECQKREKGRYTYGDLEAPSSGLHSKESSDADDVPEKPGAIRVRGSDFVNEHDLPVEDSVVPSSQDAHMALERNESIAKAITVSDEDLVQEYREQILGNIVTATNVIPEDENKPQGRGKTILTVTLAVLAVLGIVVGVLFALGGGSDASESVIGEESNGENGSAVTTPSDTPTREPRDGLNTSDESKRDEDAQSLKKKLADDLFNGRDQLDDPNSVYFQVFERMVNDPTISLKGKGSEFRFFLTAFFETTDGEQWKTSSNWNTSKSFCEWHGVTCATLQTAEDDEEIASLELPSNNIHGPLLPELNKLKCNVFDFSNNMLTGTIPDSYGKLKDIELFNVVNNLLTGEVPFCGKDSQEDVGEVIVVDCDEVECRCCTPSCESDKNPYPNSDASTQSPTQPPFIASTPNHAPTRPPTSLPTQAPFVETTPSLLPPIGSMPTTSLTTTPTKFPTTVPTNTPTRAPTHNPSTSLAPPSPLRGDAQDFYDRLYPDLYNGGAQLDNPNSVYAQVFNRMIGDSTISLKGSHAAFRLYLTVFFETTQGDQWNTNTNWDTSSSICSWYGITCLEDETLVYLDLSNNNLRGPILPELGLLRWTQMDLSNNMLTGSIPDHLGKLKDIIFFDSSGNQLTGKVPFCKNVGQNGEIVKVDCESVECTCCTPSC